MQAIALPKPLNSIVHKIIDDDIKSLKVLIYVYALTIPLKIVRNEVTFLTGITLIRLF